MDGLFVFFLFLLFFFLFLFFLRLFVLDFRDGPGGLLGLAYARFAGAVVREDDEVDLRHGGVVEERKGADGAGVDGVGRFSEEDEVVHVVCLVVDVVAGNVLGVRTPGQLQVAVVAVVVSVAVIFVVRGFIQLDLEVGDMLRDGDGADRECLADGDADAVLAVHFAFDRVGVTVAPAVGKRGDGDGLLVLAQGGGRQDLGCAVLPDGPETVDGVLVEFGGEAEFEFDGVVDGVKVRVQELRDFAVGDHGDFFHVLDGTGACAAGADGAGGTIVLGVNLGLQNVDVEVDHFGDVGEFVFTLVVRGREDFGRVDDEGRFRLRGAAFGLQQAGNKGGVARLGRRGGAGVGEDDLDLFCRDEVARRAVTVVDLALDGHVGLVEGNGQDDVRHAGNVVGARFNDGNRGAGCGIALLGNVEDVVADFVLGVRDETFGVGVAGFVLELRLDLCRIEGLVGAAVQDGDRDLGLCLCFVERVDDCVVRAGDHHRDGGCGEEEFFFHFYLAFFFGQTGL